MQVMIFLAAAVGDLNSCLVRSLSFDGLLEVSSKRVVLCSRGAALEDMVVVVCCWKLLSVVLFWCCCSPNYPILKHTRK